MRARIAGLGKSLEEASADLGAGTWMTLTRITVPLMTPAMFAGGLLAFTLSFDNFLISFFTTGPGAQTDPSPRDLGADPVRSHAGRQCRSQFDHRLQHCDDHTDRRRLSVACPAAGHGREYRAVIVTNGRRRTVLRFLSVRAATIAAPPSSSMGLKVVSTKTSGEPVATMNCTNAGEQPAKPHPGEESFE